MKKLIFLFVFVQFFVFSQVGIRIETQTEQPVTLKKLNVNVEIISDIAITTFDMQFYNPNNRVLEGEFFFPLGQGQSVTRFALDINGNLRDAVVVEKEKARVAFETTVRRKIDPALLEVTKGNNYKSRIYPIPAKGYKRIVVTCKQKLINLESNYYYKIPPLFKNKLETFNLDISILNQYKTPKFKQKKLAKFILNKINNLYEAKYSKKNFKATNEIIVKIPLKSKKEEFVFSDDYFYFKKQIEIIPNRISKLSKITIFWDNSSSQAYKKTHREILLLEAFFKKNPNTSVNLVMFNASLDYEKGFKIKNANWSALKKELEQTIYDGGSSFNILKSYKKKSDKYLLFTDGINTLSNANLKLNKTIDVINSSSIANHTYLENLAQLNKGKYINLSRLSTEKAAEELNSKPLLFLGTNLKNTELYPEVGTVVNNNFTLSGYGLPSGKEIELNFGYGKNIVKTITVKLGKTHQLKSTVVKNTWVEQKIKNLLKDKENNKDDIIFLSKKHQIISPFTSMIVLDRVEDYVEYEIKPPAELLGEYNRLMARKTDNRKERYAGAKKSLKNEYIDYFEWYNKKIELNKKIIKNIGLSVRKSKKSRKTIKIVVNVYNEYLEKIENQIKGSNITVKTNRDGQFEVKTGINDVLVFSYDGYQVEEIPITSEVLKNGVNVILKERSSTDQIVISASRTLSVIPPPPPRPQIMEVREDDMVLREAVIQSAEADESVEAVKVEDIEEVSEDEEDDIVEEVAFYVVDKKTKKPSKKTASGKSINLVGKIYIVNGKEVKQKPTFRSSEIKELYYLNDKQGQQLYGKRGSNGVAVYVTKIGYRNEQQTIRNFEKEVENKIEFKGWNPETPYLSELNGVLDVNLYKKYLEIKPNYQNSPSFFIDIASLFFQRNLKKKALKILSNVVESDIDNYELLRSLAYKYEEFGDFEKAAFIYREILKLRPEDIQSYRDLALALENNGKYQEALDLFYKIVNGELVSKDLSRRFKGIENIAMIEMNHLITLHKKDLVLSNIEKEYIKELSMDTRVIIDWNHNDTDIDLWVTDPDNEKCYYSHKKTKIGGRISDDMTSGFGPEQFVLKNAIKGRYIIKANYYGSSQQKLSGPTFLKATYFKNYGTSKEEKSIKLLRLTKGESVISIGDLIYK